MRYNRYSNNRFSRKPFPRRNRGSFKTKINESQYIRKSEIVLEAEAYVPQLTFDGLDISPTLKANIVSKGYTQPTPIQDKVIPHIMEGKDVVGIANTGTGKTAAFLIPLIQKIIQNPQTKVFIVLPTRELGQQIRDELRHLTRGMSVYSTLIIGGASIRNQLIELRRKPHFVIGTPGRMKDLVKRGALNLAQFNTVVLDEVDRMVDMGFIVDIKHLISLLPKERQSLFFSATVSPKINIIIQEFLKNPITISVKTRESSANVDQDVVRINGTSKIIVLEDLLKKDEFKKVLIFGETKRGVERLSQSLYEKGFQVASIHGDKTQYNRREAIRLFKEDKVRILVATDVAARGLDIPDITHVINYDQPASYDDYVHRIGRTGRANQKGKALTFV
ncbi:MAG: DEAD/DEAH box helicase [Patescibacteria group bacterium]